MKKLLLIAALASLSTPAFATKARLNALGNADHLVDTQTVFDNPSHMALMGDYVTFEAGPTNSASTVVPGTTTWMEYENGITANPGAEGGFVRSMGDAKYGFYMGRRSAFTDTVRRGFGFLRQENPIELQYAQKGAMNWGAALNYSSSDKKTTQQKQQAMGLRVGASTEQWDAFAVVGLGSTADGNTAAALVGSNDTDADGIIDAGELTVVTADATSKYKGTTGFKVGAGYNMNNVRLYGKFYMDGMKYESSNATNIAASLEDVKVEASQFDIGAIDHNKIDGGQWFYGVALQMYTAKTQLGAIASNAGAGDIKTTATNMPFMVGIEYDAASWATLRGSATQNVLLGSRKVDNGAAAGVDEANTISHNTKVAAGLGLRFGKWVADGSWAASTTGNINTTNFMTNLGMTYMF
jgi:hypothetical protein